MPRLTPPSFARRFWRDRRGVSAVEFALLAPVLILFYCGMAELTQAMMAQRRLSNITASIGDLTAQRTRLTDADRTDIFTIGRTIMAPYPTTTLRMCLVSVSANAAGKATVDWSEPSNAPTGCPAAGAVLTTVPAAVLPASQSVIMAKASYAYASPIRLILPNDLTFSRTFYLRPRKSDSVARAAT